MQQAALLAVALVLGTTVSGRCDEDSQWSTDLHSAMRLLAGSNLPGSSAVPWRAGIELRLDAGWKTYWRYAGDTGLPPRFDFAGSQNAKSITVLWPAPTRFADGAGGHSIGYTGSVIFPVHIVAEDPAKPVMLQATMSYGVCGKICIPAEGKAELRLTPGPSSKDSLLAAAEARVPTVTGPRADGPLAIRAAHYDTSGGKPRVVVEVKVPQGAKADLFVEGPDAQWSLPLPRPLEESNTGTQRRFIFDVEGAPRGTDIRHAQITLTLVADEKAVEVTTGLD